VEHELHAGGHTYDFRKSRRTCCIESWTTCDRLILSTSSGDSAAPRVNADLARLAIVRRFSYESMASLQPMERRNGYEQKAKTGGGSAVEDEAVRFQSSKS
jgi:hypothetical protein